MTESVSDKLLKGLYFQREDDGSIGWGRITELIPDTSTWRIVADHLYDHGLIDFNHGGIAKLTDKGIWFCENKSFLDPAIPVIELEDL